jgi:hypothetical protein
MSLIFKWPGLIFFLFLASLGCDSRLGISKPAFAFDIDDDRVLWNQLSYRAKSLFGKLTTDVHLTAVPVEEAGDLLISDPDEEGLLASGETIINLTVTSNIEPLFGSDEILNTQSLFNPNGSGALQRVRLRQGKDKWQKRYRFTQKGVSRLRIKPKNSREEKLPPDQWTKIRNHFYAYGDTGRACRRILEPGYLLFFVSALKLTAVPNQLSLCVFNKKQLHRVDVSLKGSRTLKINYLEKQDENQSRVVKAVDTIKFSFQPRPLAPPGVEPEEFSFLGLKGDFDIYVDKASKLPVLISGRIAAIGKLEIKLQEVDLRTKRD